MTAVPCADAPGVRVVHHVPGRLRVRVDGVREGAELLRRVAPLLDALPAPAAVRVNAPSGSVVIEYPMSWNQANPAGTHRARSGSPPAVRQVFVPLAVGAAIRLVLPRGRPSPFWMELTLLALEVIVSVRRSRHPPSPKP